MSLEILGDLSGSQVVLAGTLPKDSSEVFTFIAAIKPQSALAMLAVNAILHPHLCDLFAASSLEGATVEHFNWGAKISFQEGAETISFGLARVESAVLIGTDFKSIARIVKQAKISGVPQEPITRLGPGWVWGGQESSAVNFMIRRDDFDQKVGLRRRVSRADVGGRDCRCF